MTRITVTLHEHVCRLCSDLCQRAREASTANQIVGNFSFVPCLMYTCFPNLWVLLCLVFFPCQHWSLYILCSPGQLSFWKAQQLISFPVKNIYSWQEVLSSAKYCWIYKAFLLLNGSALMSLVAQWGSGCWDALDKGNICLTYETHMLTSYCRHDVENLWIDS